MKATRDLHEMGQSLWLDNITRGLLTSDTLRRYIEEFSVIDLDALAARLQEDGAMSFVQSWDELMTSIASKGEATKVAG